MKAIFTDGTKAIYFPIGSYQARTGDVGTVQMDTAAVIANDRTCAPNRYLAESFGYTVGWEAAARTVIINRVWNKEAEEQAMAAYHDFFLIAKTS